MAELRITLKVPEVNGERGSQMLKDLAEGLHAQVPGEEPPQPIPDIDDDGVINPMFLLRVPDVQTCAAVLRSVGSWHMQHPEVTVVLKSTGRGGRVALQLTRFSTVAFAEAASKIRNSVAGEEGQRSSS